VADRTPSKLLFRSYWTLAARGSACKRINEKIETYLIANIELPYLWIYLNRIMILLNGGIPILDLKRRAHG
jgi:hypothetical protein